MKRVWQGFPGQWVLLVLVVASGIGLGELADYAAEPGSPHDSVKFSLKEDALWVDVTSATGIGRVTISVKDGARWPETVVLAIRTKDGKPLKELEGFKLSGKMLRINGARRTSGRMHCYETDPDNPGKRVHQREVKVEVTKTKAAMEVRVPGKLLAGERELQVQWVDFYR